MGPATRRQRLGNKPPKQAQAKLARSTKTFADLQENFAWNILSIQNFKIFCSESSSFGYYSYSYVPCSFEAGSNASRCHAAHALLVCGTFKLVHMSCKWDSKNLLLAQSFVSQYTIIISDQPETAVMTLYSGTCPELHGRRSSC